MKPHQRPRPLATFPGRPSPPADDVALGTRASPTEKVYATFGDREIEVVDRLACFVEKGTACATCDVVGLFFALELAGARDKAAWTLNLYGHDGEALVYFTKDHIIPRAKKGPDTLENDRTMCWPCNSRRGCGPTPQAPARSPARSAPSQR